MGRRGLEGECRGVSETRMLGDIAISRDRGVTSFSGSRRNCADAFLFFFSFFFPRPKLSMGNVKGQMGNEDYVYDKVGENTDNVETQGEDRGFCRRCSVEIQYTQSRHNIQ